ncbi:MAG: hypothetical protein R2711_02365 [Acidimicrobiales bacterium]
MGAGHRAYLVGGIVRDQLLRRELGPGGHRPHDRRHARADQGGDRARGRCALDQGERFGTIGAKVGGRAFEITTHRAEAYARLPQAHRRLRDRRRRRPLPATSR